MGYSLLHAEPPWWNERNADEESVIFRVATMGEMFVSKLTLIIHRSGEPMVTECKWVLIS